MPTNIKNGKMEAIREENVRLNKKIVSLTLENESLKSDNNVLKERLKHVQEILERLNPLVAKVVHSILDLTLEDAAPILHHIELTENINDNSEGGISKTNITNIIISNSTPNQSKEHSSQFEDIRAGLSPISEETIEKSLATHLSDTICEWRDNGESQIDSTFIGMTELNSALAMPRLGDISSLIVPNFESKMCSTPITSTNNTQSMNETSIPSICLSSPIDIAQIGSIASESESSDGSKCFPSTTNKDNSTKAIASRTISDETPNKPGRPKRAARPKTLKESSLKVKMRRED